MMPCRQLAMRKRFSAGSPVHQREHAADRAHRVGRVERRHDEVARLGGLERDLHRLFVADLADEDDVGVLPQRRAERRGEARRVEAHLALADARHLVPVQELDRVLDRHDVQGPRARSGARSCSRSTCSCRCRRRRPRAPSRSASRRARASPASGSPSDSIGGMSVGMKRITTARLPRWRYTFTRKRPIPGGEVGRVVFLELVEALANVAVRDDDAARRRRCPPAVIRSVRK